MTCRARRAGGLVAAALVAAAAGCSLLRPAGEGADAGSPGTAPTADTTAARAPADTGRAAGGPDGAAAARPAADSALRALRDSARVMQERRGHGGAEAPGDSARRRSGAAREDSAAGGYPHGPVTVTDPDSLRALGPVYTPYDRAPVMREGDYLDGLLRAAVVPVIQNHDLSPETWARFWVLVGPEGRVRATEMHLGSGHAAFDAAAHAVAERLRYLPAERDGKPVPAWVLARISLLMG